MEIKLGAISAMFYHNRDKLIEASPDFGKSLGFDGKKLYSHSTCRTRAYGTCSEPDADWGRHDFRGKDANGNDGKHPRRIFGTCPRSTRKWEQIFDR